MLAFLRRHEAALLACGEDTLPESISNLRFTSHVEVRLTTMLDGTAASVAFFAYLPFLPVGCACMQVKALIADALSLKADTPESYCRCVHASDFGTTHTVQQKTLRPPLFFPPFTAGSSASATTTSPPPPSSTASCPRWATPWSSG